MTPASPELSSLAFEKAKRAKTPSSIQENLAMYFQSEKTGMKIFSSVPGPGFVPIFSLDSVYHFCLLNIKGYPIFPSIDPESIDRTLIKYLRNSSLKSTLI